MSIGIIGAKGNMGRRYAAICRYLSVPWLGFDVDNIGDLFKYAESLRSFIVATPTNTHLELILKLSQFGKPMLVEKPVITTEAELKVVLELNPQIRMVNQYQYLYDSASDGESYYDYWNSGKDGVWDFINIIGLAQKPPILRNESPLWKCQINGKQLSIRDMDHAYCDMIWNWHKNPSPNIDYLERSHRRVLEGFYVR